MNQIKWPDVKEGAVVVRQCTEKERWKNIQVKPKR